MSDYLNFHICHGSPHRSPGGLLSYQLSGFNSIIYSLEYSAIIASEMIFRKLLYRILSYKVVYYFCSILDSIQIYDSIRFC